MSHEGEEPSRLWLERCNPSGAPKRCSLRGYGFAWSPSWCSCGTIRFIRRREGRGFLVFSKVPSMNPSLPSFLRVSAMAWCATLPHSGGWELDIFHSWSPPPETFCRIVSIFSGPTFFYWYAKAWKDASWDFELFLRTSSPWHGDWLQRLGSFRSSRCLHL